MSLRPVPVFPGAGQPVAAQQAASGIMRRTRRWSWMVSGWFEPFDLVADGGGTACMTLGCTDDFVAVRLGFANVSRRPWRLTRVIARPSASFGDYATPTGAAPWRSFTLSSGGIVDRADAPTEIEVAGVQDDPSRVAWTWTDWAPIRSLAPDPATGLRVLMLRGLLPSGQTVTCANGQLRAFRGNASLNHGHDILIGGLKFNIDAVSDPNRNVPNETQTWIDNQLAPGTLFPLVQFLTVRPGLCGIMPGDSHAQGTATTEQFSSYGLVATGLLGRAFANAAPFSMVNCAVGGLGSEEFFARFEALVPAVQPSYAVLPGWTYNDSNGPVRADRAAMDVFFARMLMAMETCEANRILPVLLTPFPRDAERMTEVQIGPWRWLRERILAMRGPGLPVVDATAILGRHTGGVFDGTYLPAMTDDQMHPNDAGHAAVARAIADAVRSFL